MIRDLALAMFLGKPLIMYAGIFSFVSLIFTALIGILNAKRVNLIPFKWHRVLAAITLVLAFVHAVLGLSLSFRF